ncbi:MAG TPA: helix-turn-helix transcriptional regulator [Actinomycetota bacterium]|nr:helix-turn-helix transcriptional regulator [Actinomycetota bacterium]
MLRRGDDGALKPQVPDVGGYIRDQRRRARVSLRKLSELAGVSNPYLSQIERGLRQPSTKMLQQILQGMAQVMRVSADTLYDQIGLKQGDTDDSSVLPALLKDPNLTEGQRRALAQAYEQARTETAERRSRRRQKRPEAGGGADS